MPVPTTPPYATFSAPPPLSTEALQSLVQRHYSLQVEIKGLRGERDQNSVVMDPQGTRYILKIHPPEEEESAVDFQSRALMHLQMRDPMLPVPRVIRTREGHDRVRSEEGRLIRMLSYCGGTMQVDLADPPYAALGRSLAHLAIAFADFSHPSQDYPLLWDIKRLHYLRPFLEYCPRPWLPFVEEILESRIQRLSRSYGSLPHQVIHNDANPGNVLYEGGQVSGIIDFGDMVAAPRIQELAVAGAYLDSPSRPGWHHVSEMLSGYCDVLPLSQEELELLPTLLQGRALQSLLIGLWKCEPDAPHIKNAYLRLQRFVEFENTQPAFTSFGPATSLHP